VLILATRSRIQQFDPEKLSDRKETLDNS